MTPNTMTGTEGTVAGGQKAPNTAYMLASFHNTLNAIDAAQNVITLTATAALTAGTPFAFTMASRAAQLPLDGAMLYAQDVATGARLGTFTDTGATFSEFPACGKDAAGNNFGVVHHQIVAGGGTYSQLSWNAPATLTAGQQIAIKGLAVDDNGFGFHCTIFTVGSTTATPCQCGPTGAIISGGGNGAANTTTTMAAKKKKKAKGKKPAATSVIASPQK